MNQNTINRIRQAILLPNVTYDEYNSIKEILDKSQNALKEQGKSVWNISVFFVGKSGLVVSVKVNQNVREDSLRCVMNV